MTDKKQQRNQLKERIAAIHSEEKREFGRKIAEAAISCPAFFQAKRIFVFCSTEDEPDTSPIINAALTFGKEVYLPRIEGENMVLVRYEKGSETFLNRYGIREPKGVAYKGEVDLAFLPLLGFDREKHRLGRGKGYYDRFLARFEGASICLAFSAQELPEIAVDVWDKTPDHILTEREML